MSRISAQSVDNGRCPEEPALALEARYRLRMSRTAGDGTERQNARDSHWSIHRGRTARPARHMSTKRMFGGGHLTSSHRGFVLIVDATLDLGVNFAYEPSHTSPLISVRSLDPACWAEGRSGGSAIWVSKAVTPPMSGSRAGALVAAGR